MINRTNDFIKVTNMKVFARHGVLPEEKENGQEFFLNAKVYVDMRKAGLSDNLDDALNYDKLCVFLQEVFKEKRFDLIEAAAEYTVQEIMVHFRNIQAMELEVRKPHAPVKYPPEDISVTIYREWHKVYLSIGSNYKNALGYLNEGMHYIKEPYAIRRFKRSELIKTKPYGPVPQDDFINACIAIETYMEPEELITYIRELEDYFERDRSIKWGPRPFDLDILFFDDWVYNSDMLTIPHVEIQNRMFVLGPLSELCPGFRHPVLGKTVIQMKEELEQKGYQDEIVETIEWKRHLTDGYH